MSTNSLTEVNTEIKRCEEELAQLRGRADDLRGHERAGVIDKVRAQIVEYGLTAAELSLIGRGTRARRTAGGSSKGIAKYRGPDGKTWSGGRGRKPRWVVEALAAGKPLSDYEIR